MKKAIAISIFLMAAAMTHADTETVDGITWTYTVANGVASVGGGSSSSTAVPKSTSGSITIPSTLGGYTVTSIGDSAFYYCTELTNVSLPNSVVSIGQSAFYYCKGLESVTMPNSVTNIGDGAFSCSGLTNLLIPDAVAYIGEHAFHGCGGLTDVMIPNSVISIGRYAFSWCSGLTSITVGSGNSVYSSVNGLLLSKDGTSLICGVNGDVVIPNGVTCIGYGAFSMFSGLTSVMIPDSVTDIESDAFFRCSGLTSITVGSGNSVYSSVNGLLLSKDGTTLICGVNGDVIIPKTVTSVKPRAFDPCSGLTSIIVESGNTTYSSINGLLLSKDEKTLIKGVNGDVIIPDGVTSIKGGAFEHFNGLTSVTIPNSVTNFSSYAIQDCSGLTNVIFFGDCPTSFNEWTFSHLYHMTIHVSRYASGWDEAIAEGTWMGYPICYVDIAEDRMLCDYWELPDGTIRLDKYTGRNVDEIYVPQTIDGKIVSAISWQAFSSCAGLKSITIPSTVTWIEDEAFAFCTSLTSVTYLGDAPDVGINIYKGTPRSLVIHVPEGSIGWADDFSDALPSAWNGRRIVYTSDSGSGDSGSIGGGTGAKQVALTVTNVVVHYVLNSVVPEIAVPVSGDAGFVTVVTEIKGGVVAVAESWAENYPSFAAKFGSVFTAALTKPSGKRDAQGNALMVWQDYVAGTDPTDENDVFKASITLVDGVPLVSYTPELPEAEKAKRKYTTYGKARLQDAEWSVVDGDADKYNFFKVTVEMR